MIESIKDYMIVYLITITDYKDLVHDHGSLIIGLLEGF